MLKGKKTEVINRLVEDLSRSTIIIATDYRGLSAKEMSQLRRLLSDLGIEYRVVKNSLVHLAAEKAGKKAIDAFLKGPLAIAFGYSGEVKPAQALAKYLRTSGSPLQIKGGLLGNRLLSREEILIIATLPSGEVLISQLVAQLKAPIQNFSYVLQAPWQRFLNILQARIRQIEGG